jgi:hypothetical protein
MRLLGRRLSRGYDGGSERGGKGSRFLWGKKGQIGRCVRCDDRGCQDVASRHCRI